MADADTHLAKARAELDRAIAKLSDRLAESASKQKQLRPLTWEKLASSGVESKDDAALISRLVNLSLDDYFSATKPDKPIAGKVSSFVSSLLPLTLVALGLVGKAFDASLMGVPVSAIANGTCYIIDLVIKERDRKDLFLAKLDHISYQARRVHEIQRYPDTVLLPLLREKALNLLTAVTLFLDGAIDYFTRSLVKQITKSVFKSAEAWQTQITQLQVACEEYDQALLLQVASTILRRSTPTDAVSDGNDAKIRAWLQPSAAENESRMMANLGQRAKGTLQWVLRMPELKDWRLADTSGKARTFWLTGLPGVGKSCISAYLCDLLPPQYPDDIMLNFFCKRDTPGLNSAFAIIKTLCYQLMRADDFYWKFLQEAPDLPKTNTKDDIAFLIDKLLKKPINAGPKGQTIFILLDGLDEVEESAQSQGRSSTAKTDVEILLEQIVSLPRVKILATSRPLPELDRVLSNSGAIRQIGPADNAEDIENYVAHRVAGSDRLRDGFSGLGVDSTVFFTSRANGIFLWVSVVLDVLERAISTNAFKQSLDEIHPTINGIYDDIFKRAEQRGSLVLIMEILHWVVIVPTPFTVRQMALAVEISLGDKVVKMEEFLRTECGAFLTLVPHLGSTSGASSSDESLEVTIGHETFQAWLSDRLGRAGRLITHAKAATACLRYLLEGERNNWDLCLRSYALDRWLWHVRHSMDVGDRQFAEPLSVLAAGLPVPESEVAPRLFLHLYRFLSQQAAETWIKGQVERESYNHRVFWEVQRTCMEVAGWYKANRDGITDKPLQDLGLEGAEASRIKAWGETLDNPQVIAQMLWPSVCHAWLWNTSAGWWSAYWSVEGLHQLYIYAHGRELFETTEKTKELLEEETRIVEKNAGSDYKSSGQLHGTLTTHFANVMIGAKELKGGDPNPEATYECLESVKTAGRYSDLSGVCAANLSVFFYEMWRNDRVPDSEVPLQKALDAIQEAIDDDPDGSPRNYYHLGRLYQALVVGQKFEADEQEFRRMALDAYRDAVARDPDHTTDARGEVYQAEEDALRKQKPPLLDAAVELLERAIIDDPENSRNKWYHHLFDVHKERGDLAAARDTYRRLIAFDPSWHPRWQNIADTWIDENSYEEKRTFDWPNWCDALLEAIEQDPSYAHSYWDSWRSKASSLLSYGHFDIAIDILRYGVESSAQRSDASAIKACVVFYFRAGEALGMKGHWGEAIPQLENAFARSERLDIWGQRNTLKWLAWAYMAEKRWDDAVAVAEKRLALAPHKIWGDPLRQVAHGWMGEIALYQGKYTVAVKEFKTAVRMEEEVLVKEAKGDPDQMMSDDMARCLLDLGIAYDQMGRSNQAVAVFKKALPHVEHMLREKIQMRENNDGMWRREGRWHMLLAWALEKTCADGVSNPRVLEEYKLAEWVFRRTVYVEDDFVEFGDLAAAEREIKRVKDGQAYAYPDEETFLGERMRLKIGSTRADWANHYYRDEVQKARYRGHG